MLLVQSGHLALFVSRIAFKSRLYIPPDLNMYRIKAVFSSMYESIESGNLFAGGREGPLRHPERSEGPLRHPERSEGPLRHPERREGPRNTPSGIYVL